MTATSSVPKPAWQRLGHGMWQAVTLERLHALDYAGFVFGPGVNWWPIDDIGQKVAGPFTMTAEFDAWLTQQEASAK
jgi:hypothetical protein